MSNLTTMLGLIEPEAPPSGFELGLSPVLDTISGQLNAWSQRTVDISAYAGATVRPVFYYVSGGSYTGDLQLDLINVDGTSYSFESNTTGWQTTTSEYTDYSSVVWASVPTVASTSPRFSRDSGGTGSTGTGRTDAADGSFYLYAETSSPGYPNTPFWLRGPEVTLSSSPTFSYYEARYGATIGTLNFYLDVIS